VKTLGGCRLYGILDFGYVRPRLAADVAARMVEGGVDILQIRAKKLPEEQIVDIAQAVAPITRASGVPLILNDYPHLASRAGADGVHVGQDDLSVAEAREAIGAPAIVGKSTHSVHQAIAAAAEGADYIGFGPLFSTPTKPDYAPIGLDQIRIVHERVSVPIFCFGGIKLENLASVLAAGAGRVVIVSGILQAADIARYTCAVQEALALNPQSEICNPK
jgi:thiamine-phosphate pyrophosphorylase